MQAQRFYEEKTEMGNDSIKSEFSFGVPLVTKIHYVPGSTLFGGEIEIPVTKIEVSSVGPHYTQKGKDLAIKLINTTDDSQDPEIMFHSLKGRREIEGLRIDHSILIEKIKGAYFKGNPLKLTLRR